MLKVNGDGGFALKVIADLIQEAAVDEGTLRTVLLARIGLMSRQHQSTSDEVQLVEGPQEFGSDATAGEVFLRCCRGRRPSGDGRRRYLAAATEEGLEGRGSVAAGRCRERRPRGEGQRRSQAAAAGESGEGRGGIAARPPPRKKAGRGGRRRFQAAAAEEGREGRGGDAPRPLPR